MTSTLGISVILLTQLILLALALVAVVLGWHSGIRKGAVAYLTTLIFFSFGAFVFSALWIIPIAALLPFALLSGGLGLASGAKFRQGKRLLAVALLSPLVIYWTGLTAIQIKKERELQQVLDFVMSDKVVTKISEKNMVIHPPGAWKMANGLLPFRYEILITGSRYSNQLYVFVDVSRSWLLGNPIFTVACVTTLSVGARDASVDVCKQ